MKETKIDAALKKRLIYNGLGCHHGLAAIPAIIATIAAIIAVSKHLRTQHNLPIVAAPLF
jgi:hypothetical protein